MATGWDVNIDPQGIAAGIQLLSDLFETKGSRQARQTKEALETMWQNKMYNMAPEMQEKYLKTLQYKPKLFGRQGEPLLWKDIPITSTTGRLSKVYEPMKEISRPPLQLPSQEDVTSATKFLMSSGYDEKAAKTGAIQWLTGLRPGTDEAEKFEDFKKRETFKAGLKPPKKTEEEELGLFEKKEKIKAGLRPPKGEKESPEDRRKERKQEKQEAGQIAALKEEIRFLETQIEKRYKEYTDTIYQKMNIHNRAASSKKPPVVGGKKIEPYDDISQVPGYMSERQWLTDSPDGDKLARQLIVARANLQRSLGVKRVPSPPMGATPTLTPPSSTKGLSYRVPGKGVITIKPEEKAEFLKHYPNAEEVR